MGLAEDLAAFEARLNRAIDDALENEVADAVKGAIIESARENVYDTYEPKFYSRRNGNGGLLDKRSVKISVFDKTLTAVDMPEWQQLFGGEPPTYENLTGAIAKGSPNFHMASAGPRPFHDIAKQNLLKSGDADAALAQGLERNGFTVTTGAITIV